MKQSNNQNRGIGKSTFSRICALYTEHKIDCLINPWATFGLMPGKKLVEMFSHMSISVVEREFIGWFKANKEKSPYYVSSDGEYLEAGYGYQYINQEYKLSILLQFCYSL